MNDLIEVIVIACLFFGIIVRTALPALRKWKEQTDLDEPFVWSHRYTITMITSLIVSLLSALGVYQLFVIPEGTITQVAIAAFFTGLGLNSGITELSKWVI